MHEAALNSQHCENGVIEHLRHPEICSNIWKTSATEVQSCLASATDFMSLSVIL